MVNAFKLYLLLTYWIIPLFSYGQSLVFKNITVNEGLSNNFVKSIFKDKDGFVWIGTLEGLNRFDGQEIKSYGNYPDEFKESINTICQADEDYMWIGTDAGLFLFDLKTELFTPFSLSKGRLKVLSLFKSSKGTIYVGTSGGLFLLRNQQLINSCLFDRDLHAPDNTITGVAESPGGNLWISTLGGLVHLNSAGKPIDRFTQPGGFACITYKDKLYLGVKSKGLKSFDVKTLRFQDLREFSNDIVLTLQNDGKALVFAGTDGSGLKVFNIRSAQISAITNSGDLPFAITSASVYSFLYDKGSYWIGTYSGGLNYSVNSKILFTTKSFGSDFHTYNKSIRSFYFSKNKDVLVGSRNGLYFYDSGSKRINHYSVNNTKKLTSNIILTIIPYGNDYLIGTYGSGVRFFRSRDQSFSNFMSGDDFVSGSVYQIKNDETNNLWVATLNGIYKVNPENKSTEHYTTANAGLPGNETYSILIDSRKRIWAGTMNGTGLLFPGKNKFDKTALPAGYNNLYKVNHFYEDRDSSIWICTEKGGLFHISSDLKTSENFNTNDGLPDNAVCAISQDVRGDYWVSTLNGFCKIPGKSRQVVTYSLSDGLPGTVFNPSAVYKSPEGQMYWGNEKGMVTFDPGKLSESSADAPIVITRFFLGGREVGIGPESPLKQSIETTGEIILPYSQSSIGFRFVALNYRNPLDNYYACLLEGHDADWKVLGNKDEVYYNNLRPGKYVFKVKLLGSQNSSSIEKLTVVINPSFFRTPFFFIPALTIIGLFGWWVYREFAYLRNKMREVGTSLNVGSREKYKASKLTVDMGEKIGNNLHDYLNSELKLSDVAAALDYSVHEISQVLNQYMQTNFPDFINSYRIEELKKRMSDDQYLKYTLTAIAGQCGFSSKASFYRAFKKATQKTPAEYFKNLR
jgi:ligand-binding sensor domain-containing protein/AraC-like DNA-binding protein